MSLIDKVENLQKKPESYRKKILAASVLVFMGLIVFVWLITLNFSLGAEAEGTKDAYTPFQILGKDLMGVKDNLNASVGEIKGLFNQIKNGAK
ncbi:MAG: hypothetical protein WC587_02795 [Candidatus Paceibacterota bacterium]